VLYFETSNNNLAYLLAQLCYISIDELDFEDYYESLCDVFSKEQLQKAMNIFELKDYFIDISFHQDYLNLLELYDNLAIKKQSIKAN